MTEEMLRLLKVIAQDDTPASMGDLMDALQELMDVPAVLQECEQAGLVEYRSRPDYSWRLTAQGRNEI